MAASVHGLTTSPAPRAYAPSLPPLRPAPYATRQAPRNTVVGDSSNKNEDKPKPRQPPPMPDLDWGKSIPSYLQSTTQSEICDDWADAINEAEAIAAARKKAIEQGLDPAVAEDQSRAEVRLSRSVSTWNRIRQEATRDIEGEPMLSSFLFTSILSHDSFGEALAFVLSNRIADETLLPTQLFSLFMTLERKHPEVLKGALADLQAVYDRDPACLSYSQALLYFKGYHAIQLHRFAHALWESGRDVMALLLQSRLSEVLAVDIHPAAKFGQGVLLDHGTGVVIGETAVVGNGVSIMQNVTLGGTGKVVGDRHPKIANNVLIGAGASVLGNIEVGTGAQVAAGSLVLKPVEPHTMVAGSPAQHVGAVIGNPAASLNQWSQDSLRLEEGKARREYSERSVMTRSGGPVRRMGDSDYLKHVSAEASIYSSDAARSCFESGSGAGSTGNSSKQNEVAVQQVPKADVDSHLKPFQAREVKKPIDATTSDEVAEKMWGAKPEADPEFFI